MSKANSYKASKQYTMFVPAFIDEYGFTPDEFRVFARIMRRCLGTEPSTFFEGIPKIADALKMSERQVRRAMKLLERCGAIVREQRPGRADLIEFTSCSKWADKDKLDEWRNEIDADAKQKDRERKKTLTPVDSATTTPVGSARGTPSDSATTTPVGSATTPLAEPTDEGIPLKDSPVRHTQEGDACAPLKAAEEDGASVVRFAPRDPPRKFKTGSVPAGDVPQAFGPWRDAFEDWWCQMLSIVSLPANVDTSNDLAWLFDNGFTLDEIKAFYKWATTDPDEKKWRRGPVKIGTIVKGIADWRKQNREQAAAKPVVRQDFSWCLNGCDPKTGEIWLKGEGGAWVPTQCQHRRLEVMEDAA